MSEELMNTMKLLSPDKRQEVVDFAAYLLQKYKPTSNSDNQELAERRMKLAGRLKGQIWMADDFNETPEDFKDYM